MLLEFKIKNYKSFKEEVVFKMTPAPKQKGLDYSLLKESIENKEYKGLSSAVIYGPNAAGKTNLIDAMHTLKSIIIRGHIRNVCEKTTNPASYKLELIPNKDFEKKEAVVFSIQFIHENLLFRYELSIDLGLFLEKNFERKINKETLYINNSMIYRRTTTLQIGNIEKVQQYFIDAYQQNIKSAEALAQSSLNSEELFLTNGFKTIFSVNLFSKIYDWFTNYFSIIYGSDYNQVVKRGSQLNKKSIVIDKTINEAAKIFGITADTLGYIFEEQSDEAKLYSIFDTTTGTETIPIEIFESLGTIRFVNIFPLILRTLLEGGVLFIDEFDASIHPIALMNIVTMFHNDEINVAKGQLIFNTHNPIFLNSNLFRRDEIKFVDREHKDSGSIHYSLADFKTAGSAGVRKTEDYMKNYFVDRYGAIKDIDFTSVIKKYAELSISDDFK